MYIYQQQLHTLHLSGDCFAPTIAWHASELLLAVNFDPRSLHVQISSPKTKQEKKNHSAKMAIP
jgi:hypothetical protein